MGLTRRKAVKGMVMGAAAISLPSQGLTTALNPSAAQNKRLENLNEVFATGIVVDSMSGFRPNPKLPDAGFGEVKLSGASVVSSTLGSTLPEDAYQSSITSISGALADIAQYSDRMLLVRGSSDVERAKKDGKLGVIVNFQNSVAIGTDLKNLDFFYRLGLRQIQMTFNYRNWVGDGCTERYQSGLSTYGVDMVHKMNELGILVDVSHSGYQTTLDAIEASSKPIVFSHTNCKAVNDHPRCKSDDQIKALAKKGGVMGISNFNWFVSAKERSNLADLMKHFDHAIRLVGPDHVGIGSDFQLPLWPGKVPDEQWEAHKRIYPPAEWDKLHGRFPPYIDEVNTPRRYWIVAEELQKRGVALEDIRKILGLNFVRVYKEVLKA